MASDDAVSFAKSREKIELCVSIRDRELATSGKACAFTQPVAAPQLVFQVEGSGPVDLSFLLYSVRIFCLKIEILII